MVRLVKNPQMEFGEVDISQIQLDPKSRDDIPQILKGLQHIYINPSLRQEVFSLLEKHISPRADKKNGRPGMELWKIFVLGVLRLDLNCDYDRVKELANQHKTIRQMLGHKDWYDETHYHMQTIKDNVSLLTPELLDEVNQVVVRAGHILLKKKENEVLRGRSDSFVVETDVHYPTDINLLFDALRKMITLTARLCEDYEISDWRQYQYNIRQAKRLMRVAQRKKRYSGRTDEQKEKNKKEMKRAHQEYIQLGQFFVDKMEITLSEIQGKGLHQISDIICLEQIKHFMGHARRQIDQIDRRVLQGEVIPHEEKCFSLFEPHTEWISKGKAGVPVELGLRVCVMEDQYQFILYHHVMEKQTDDQVAILMVEESQRRFPALKIVSFDKGFHSPENQRVLSGKLEVAALPRKGRLSEAARALEESEAFRYARRKHAAVESGINALEVHGLDRCLDHGIEGFKCYVALAIVARNIQRIGALLQKKEQKKWERRKRRMQNELKIAA
jgi:transposase, IS5 family